MTDANLNFSPSHLPFPSSYFLPLSPFPSSPTYSLIPSSRLHLLPPLSPPSPSPEVGVRGVTPANLCFYFAVCEF